MGRNKMKIEFDGIGFVNNRGTSKYWGVCKALNDDKNYRITVKDGNDTCTFHPDPNLGRITEEVAAQLAASLYEYRFSRLPAYVNVRIGNITYRLDSTNNKIYKILSDVATPVQGPVDNTKATALTSTPEDMLNRTMDKYNISDDERQFINLVFDKATGSDLSYRGRMILAAGMRSIA